MKCAGLKATLIHNRSSSLSSSLERGYVALYQRVIWANVFSNPFFLHNRNEPETESSCRKPYGCVNFAQTKASKRKKATCCKLRVDKPHWSHFSDGHVTVNLAAKSKYFSRLD